MRIKADQAAARVHAGLGRHPQDALEAAVVLEAWGGLVSSTALKLSSETVSGRTRETAEVKPSPRRGEVSNVPTRDILGLIATLLATTAWVAPLAAAMGQETTARGWKIALPISLGMQWLLRRRYLNGPEGLGRLRNDAFALTAAGNICLSVPIFLLVKPQAVLPAALVVTWVGGLLIVVRGWGVPYAGSLVVATWALELGVPAVVDIFIVVVLTGGVLSAALGTTQTCSAVPTPWRRSMASGLTGGTMALLIVTDPSVEWTSTKPFPVLALIPSLLAGVWAGRHLNQIWTVLLDAFASTGLLNRTTTSTWRVFASIILGSFGRLLFGTLVLSLVAFVLLKGSAASQEGLARLLLGLGAFGVVSYVAALLESLSRVRAALAVVGISVLAAQGALHTTSGSLGGASLMVAAAAAAVTAVVPIARLIRRPDRTIATLL